MELNEKKQGIFGMDIAWLPYLIVALAAAAQVVALMFLA